MKAKIKIVIIAMIGMSLSLKAQEWKTNGNNSTTGNLSVGEYFSLEKNGVRHSIFNYSVNSNLYFGAGRDNAGNKKEMIFYNYSCNGGCNVPRIQFLTDVLYASGKIGIGVLEPQTPLDVKGIIKSSDGNGNVLFTSSDSNGSYMRAFGSQNINFRNTGGSSMVNFNLTDGSASFNGNLTVKKGLFSSSQSGHLGIRIERSSNLFHQITHDSSKTVIFNGNNDIEYRFGGLSKLVFKNDGGANFGGNVGIGTTNPGTWKLAVNGPIRAKEIKVETGWSDFVFYDNYKLPTLEEVERHIEEKGHLKDIPSAKEVAEDGIFLGEMDSRLLQKIEELTLYTIQQSKEIKELKEQNTKIDNQQKEIEELKLLVEKLLRKSN